MLFRSKSWVVFSWILLLFPIISCFALGNGEGEDSAVVSLDGAWEYQVLGQGKEPQTITFPTVSHQYENPQYQEYQFSRNFLPPAQIPLDEVALYLGKLPDYTEVQINGQRLLVSGSRPPGQYYGNIFQAHYVLLPEGLLNKDESNTLTLSVYTEKSSSPLPSIWIGPLKQVQDQVFLLNMTNKGLGYAMLATTLITSLFFLAMFLTDPKEKGNLYLMISSLGFALNAPTLFLEGSLINYLTMFKIHSVGLHFGVVGIVLFYQSFLQIQNKRTFSWLLLGVTTILGGILFFQPDFASALWFNDFFVYLFFITPLLFYGLGLGILGVVKKREYSVFLLIGVVFAILAGGRDILLISLGITPQIYTNLIGLGFLLLFLFLAYAVRAIRDRQKLEVSLARLSERERQLAESEKMALVGSMVAGVHHEVRTPLGNAILLSSFLSEEGEGIKKDLAQARLTESRLQDFLQKSQFALGNMEKDLGRADKLLKAFKDASRSHLKEEKRVMSSRDFLEEVITGLNPRFRGTSVDLILDNADQDFMLETYPGVLWQVLSNLVLNALRHGFEEGQKGTVCLRFFAQGSEAVILITDDGKGMEKSVLDRVFEAFFSTALDRGGSGLGLSIVKELVEEQLGGSIEMQSDLGEGTQVTIIIPVR